MLIDLNKSGYGTLINTDHVIKVTIRRIGNGDKNIITSFHMIDGSIEEFKGIHQIDVMRHCKTIIPAPVGYKLISVCEDSDIPNDEDIFFYNDIIALAIDNHHRSIKFLGVDDWTNDIDNDQIILTPDKQVVLPGDRIYGSLEAFKEEIIEKLRKRSVA